MAKVKNPILFSTYFGVKKTALEEAGFIDPFLNVDTQLFIDPVLLSKSGFSEINKGAYKKFRDHFSNYVRLLAISQKERDAPWKAAEKLLDLSEPPRTGLGYGGSGRSGSSRPDEIRLKIMRVSNEIIKLGSKDPEMISLMGFFEEKVGPDTIGDFTSKVIMLNLASLTQTFCKKNKIPVTPDPGLDGISLPKYNGKSLVLVPRDIVRDLPIANDWSDISEAAFHNIEIRNRVNGLLAGIAKPTIADKKSALRGVALASKREFESFLSAVKRRVDPYDPMRDSLGYYMLREILKGNKNLYKEDNLPLVKSGPTALKTVVEKTVQHFKHHVEKGNLWEELWNGDSPKKERASQLIYYAIADCFCKANNVDVSPECNMGGGPIDFKFSVGYNARVLVEVKRSMGTVKHGYEKQLEIYKDAALTSFGIFVIIDYGDLNNGDKLSYIQSIRNARIQNGEMASDIIVIDATKKVSASKRK